MKFPFGRRLSAAAPAPASPYATPVRRRSGGVLLFLTLILLALLLGATIGLSSPVLVTILGGLIFIVLTFLLLNSYQLVLALLVLTFLVQGTAQYFLSNRQAPWLVVGMAAIFFVRAMMELVFTRRGADLKVTAFNDRAVLASLLVFALVFGVSTVFNRPSMGQLVVAIKGVWPLFGVLLALAWLHWAPQQLERMWSLLVVFGLLQLPVVFYQHFFISGTRATTGHDSVVGTFGGNPLGGGNSAILVLFVIATMTYALSRWDKGLMSRRMVTLVCAVGLAVILLGEVKAAFIWLPLSGGLVLRRRIMRNVASFIMYLIFGMVLITGIYLTYNALYWGKLINKQHGAVAKLEAGGGYVFDPRSINYSTGEVGRGAAVAIWVNDKVASTPSRLIGYGPGAIKSGPGLGAGVLFKRFAPLHVDPTALAVLLWDVGVLGTLAYGAIFVFGIRAGWRYLKAARGTPAEQAIIETSTATLMLFATLIAYNRTLMDDPSSQLLCMLSLGCVLQCSRFGRARESAAPARQGAPARALQRAHG